MSVEQIEITDQDILKALEVLGLNTQDQDINKGEKPDFGKKDDEEEDADEKKEEDKEGEVKVDDKKAAFEKAYGDLEKAYPEYMAKCDIKKSLETMELVAQPIEENEIFKSYGSKIDALTTLVKEQRSTNDELKKSLETVNFQLEEQGKQSQGRKSFTSQRQAGFIEKSFNGEELNSSKTQLSISRDKAKIDNILLDLSGIEKGEVNEFYKEACLLHNTSGVIDMLTVNKLSREQNIQIVQ